MNDVETNYVFYNNPSSVDALDNNYVDPRKTVEMPNHIYSGEAFPLSLYLCESGPRDTRTNYIYQMERFQHPDHFSRFAYGTCFNGYCSGHWNGRYNTPSQCWKVTDAQPEDMAPERFYKDVKFKSPFYSDGPTYLWSRIARNRTSMP